VSDGLKLLALVADTGSIHVLRGLDAELFVEEERQVYTFIRSHYRRYGRIPALETIEEHTGLELPEAQETTDYYLKKITDRRLYSLLRPEYTRLKDNLRDFDMDAARQTIDDMRGVARTTSKDGDLLNFREASAVVLSDYQFAHENPGITGVPTGWPIFDAITGGYQSGDLITWVARPEMGKTYTLLRQVMGAHAAGFSVLVVTTEMPIAAIMRRYIGIYAGIDPNRIRRGMLSTHVRRRLGTLIESMSGSDRLHVFSVGKNKSTADIDMLVQELMPDIVFIDGVYLLKPLNKRASNRTEKVTEVFDDLNDLKVSSKIPFVVTTQFNRVAGKKGKEGSLESVAYSDAISTHSSLILSLQEGSAGRETTSRNAVFIKGREGEQGIFSFWYKFQPMCFDEIHEEEVEADEGNNLDWTGAD